MENVGISFLNYLPKNPRKTPRYSNQNNTKPGWCSVLKPVYFRRFGGGLGWRDIAQADCASVVLCGHHRSGPIGADQRQSRYRGDLDVSRERTIAYATILEDRIKHVSDPVDRRQDEQQDASEQVGAHFPGTAVERGVIPFREPEERQPVPPVGRRAAPGDDGGNDDGEDQWHAADENSVEGCNCPVVGQDLLEGRSALNERDRISSLKKREAGKNCEKAGQRGDGH